MPTDYHKRSAGKEASLDWLSLIGILSALLILLASSVGYHIGKNRRSAESSRKEILGQRH
jgi:hypothetical protein